MPLGSENCVLNKNIAMSLMVRAMRTADMYGHLWTRPITAWVRRNSRCFPNIGTVIEVGCGSGANIFCLAKRLPKFVRLFRFDLNEEAISLALRLAANSRADNTSLHAEDCARFQFSGKPDLVLLIDFLEHVETPDQVLRDVKKAIHPDMGLLISVPTPLYPKIFGRKFHEHVGRVMDGYDYGVLPQLVEEGGFKIMGYEYNSGPITTPFLFFYYNALFGMRGRLENILGRFLGLLRHIVFFCVQKTSCSLFAVAVPSVDHGEASHAN